MRIGIAYSLKPDDRGRLDGPDDLDEEFDTSETIDAIAEVIRGDGHDVLLLGDGRPFLAKVSADPPDFVFNMAEGEGASRNRESRVPAVCELLSIPYSGSDPLTLAATLDKPVAKRLVQDLPDFHVPKGLTLGPETSRTGLDRLLTQVFDFDWFQYPLILKPAFEGSSKGIRAGGLVETVDEAVNLFDRLARDYHQPILIEEFIDGDEVTVGVLGNGPAAEVLGIMRILPREPTERFVYSLDVKRDWQRLVRYEAPARLPESVIDRIKTAALGAFEALGCLDLARIDFRVRDGVPYFIEANPLPGLSPVTGDLVILAKGHGTSHNDLIRRILHESLTRVALLPAEPVAF